MTDQFFINGNTYYDKDFKYLLPYPIGPFESEEDAISWIDQGRIFGFYSINKKSYHFKPTSIAEELTVYGMYLTHSRYREKQFAYYKEDIKKSLFYRFSKYIKREDIIRW